MHVPVEAGSGREGGVDAGEEAGAEARGEVGADEVVGEGCEEDFVDVEREGGEGEAGGEGGGEADEERGGGEGEGVVHCWLVFPGGGVVVWGAGWEIGGALGWYGGERGGGRGTRYRNMVMVMGVWR